VDEALHRLAVRRPDAEVRQSHRDVQGSQAARQSRDGLPELQGPQDRPVRHSRPAWCGWGVWGADRQGIVLERRGTGPERLRGCAAHKNRAHQGAGRRSVFRAEYRRLYLCWGREAEEPQPVAPCRPDAVRFEA
jgi:hypothetical protein